MTPKKGRPAQAAGGLVLDTGALIAIDRGDRRVLVLIAEARRTRAILTVPAGCVAQAWRQPARQARLSAFLRIAEVRVRPLDDEDARLVGLLLGAANASDVVDGHVALCAMRLGHTVLTSDPHDIRALFPAVTLHSI